MNFSLATKRLILRDFQADGFASSDGKNRDAENPKRVFDEMGKSHQIWSAPCDCEIQNQKAGLAGENRIDILQ